MSNAGAPFGPSAGDPTGAPATHQAPQLCLRSRPSFGSGAGPPCCAFAPNRTECFAHLLAARRGSWTRSFGAQPQARGGPERGVQVPQASSRDRGRAWAPHQEGCQREVIRKGVSEGSPARPRVSGGERPPLPHARRPGCAAPLTQTAELREPLLPWLPAALRSEPREVRSR